MEEIEENYATLVKDSGELLSFVQKQFAQLDSMIDKKTSTEDAPNPTPIEVGNNKSR